MKALYKYPQNEYPYGWIVHENQNRSRQEPEFELTDTGKGMTIWNNEVIIWGVLFQIPMFSICIVVLHGIASECFMSAYYFDDLACVFSSFTQAIFDQYYAQIDSTCIEKARSQNNSGDINPSFIGLTYNTISHFTHCLYFFLTPKGLGKILCNSQNICSSYVKPSNKMNESNQMKMIPQYW